MNEVLTFFAVLVRFSALFAVLPFWGDKTVPAQVRIFLSLIISITLYPTLVASREIIPADALHWGSSVGRIAGTIAIEALFGFVLGYVSRLSFDAISVGANLIGNFMGFASASYFDPHQETQTEVIGHFKTTLAMLIFLALDGHHFILKASLQSYRIVGLGKAAFTQILSQELITDSGLVLKYGLQVAGPVAISLFTVNIILGMMAKALPQLNVFSLSTALSALVGFCVLYICIDDFQEVTVAVLSKTKDWMEAMMFTMVIRS